MKLLDRFRQLSLVGSGLFWSAYASADLPKLSGGSSSNDVMGDVKKMSQDGVAYGALVICAIAFIVVVISCVGTFITKSAMAKPAGLTSASGWWSAPL